MKPILFNTLMVQAILDGRKTQTRRVVKPQPADQLQYNPAFRTWGHISHLHIWKPPAFMDEMLYVRETWCNVSKEGVEPEYNYLADAVYCEDYDKSEWKWRPAIHMPKDAARIFLRVTDVRVERLQEITIEQILNEGITRAAIEAKLSPGSSCPRWVYHEAARKCFSELWDSTIKPTELDRYGWAANPWVWVITFERCEQMEES